MTQRVVLELPDATWRRLQQGATAARKDLPTFIIERLAEATPVLADQPVNWLEQELNAMAQLEDQQLWDITRSQLVSERQDLYEWLLEKNSQGRLSAKEAEMMREIGQEARLLTAKKAQAFMLLKWRGHQLPNLDAID
ncbi:MAG: hypothetical protein KDE56_12225 [Anaerolineales bacterium]|nr:hypothetical protein [Anaerolineales bacterium]